MGYCLASNRTIFGAKIMPFLNKTFLLSTNEGDKPELSGMYVAYIEPDINLPYAKKELLMFLDNWYFLHSDQKYRGKIYGYVGPLPGFKIEQ
jgi:hypothetical protein